jgi:hypothetical protein
MGIPAEIVLLGIRRWGISSVNFIKLRVMCRVNKPIGLLITDKGGLEERNGNIILVGCLT